MSHAVPGDVVLKETKLGIMSPLTNASAEEPTAKKGKNVSSRASSAPAGKKKPPPSTKQAPAPRTPARKKRTSEDILAVKRSPRLQELKQKKQRTAEEKDGRPSQGGSSLGEAVVEEGDDTDQCEDALSLDSQEEQDDTLEVDEGIEEANLDASSGAKQTLAKKSSVKYEKQFITLTPRTGKRIKSISFAKGYFHIPKLTAEGLKLMKSKKSK